jgi:hypothetical protein
MRQIGSQISGESEIIVLYVHMYSVYAWFSFLHAFPNFTFTFLRNEML